MKLTSAEVARTLSQYEANAIPDDHPMVAQLSELFGEHTFFLADNGLNIVEPTEPGEAASHPATAQVVNIANWGDTNQTSLAPHEPEPTEVVIQLAAN